MGVQKRSRPTSIAADRTKILGFVHETFVIHYPIFSKNIKILGFMAPKIRFAPSPTGFLHRGHVLSALWVWKVAKEQKAEILLRIEDHDQSRCRESYVDAIREDLQWLGFHWTQETRQSSHWERYQEALEELNQLGFVYACQCSRQELSGMRAYPGTCRSKQIPWSLNTPIGLRVRIPENEIIWNDRRLGSFIENPALLDGDTLLRDRLGQWTYQFSVVVDDLQEGIDWIVRGEDLLDSTARQISLGQLLGREKTAQFLHHPLLSDSNGKKLSKRELSRSIRQDRLDGISPEQILQEVKDASGFF